MLTATLKQVSKSYRLGAVKVVALQRVDLEIRASCLTVLCGPSGSGKTTLLNLIGGVDRPDTGTVVLADRPVQQLSDDEMSDFRARHIGFVFQNFSLLPVLTAYENVEYPLRLTGASRAQRANRVGQLLESVGLAAHANHRPNELSGGQQQRVAIARALSVNPRLVLADEPTANLDTQTGASIISLMRQMQQEHQVSFVISSHDPQVVEAADDTVMIRDGAIASVQRNVRPFRREPRESGGPGGSQAGGHI
jgi:putative ABC transport system ATP-binding protein